MRRTVLTIAGLIALAFGTLFLLQGLGAVRWPASSMMIDNRVWVIWGGILAALGALVLALARRRRSRP